jgi:hypothetical protein
MKDTKQEELAMYMTLPNSVRGVCASLCCIPDAEVQAAVSDDVEASHTLAMLKPYMGQQFGQ